MILQLTARRTYVGLGAAGQSGRKSAVTDRTCVALEHDMAERTKSVELSGSRANTQPRETGEYTVGSSPAPAHVSETEKAF